MHTFGTKNYGIIPPRIEIEPGIWVDRRNDGTSRVNIHPDRIEIGGADTFWEGGIFYGRPNYKWIGPLKAQPRVILHGGYWTIHTPTREEAIRLVQNAAMGNYLTNPEGKKIFFFGGWTFMQGVPTPAPISPLVNLRQPIITPTIAPTPTLPPIVTPIFPLTNLPKPTLQPMGTPNFPLTNLPKPNLPAMIAPIPPPLPTPAQGTPLLAAPNLPDFWALALAGGPTIATPVATTYRPQDTPTDADFAVTATPENFEYIQAAMETGREIYPSLEQYIQVAEWLQIHYPHRIQLGHERLFDRSNYPSFMRDASPFEIFKVYTGSAELGSTLIRVIARIFSGENRLQPPPFMAEYQPTYFGFIRRINAEPLTPETFRASITPDQAILMEAWRQKILHQPTFDFQQGGLIGLDDMLRQLVRNRHGADYYYPHEHIHYHLGFKKRDLRNAILNVNATLPPYPRFNQENRGGEMRHNRISNLIIDHVRYEGETATDKFGRDRRTKKIGLSETLPREYYMMLYNELITRGLIDATGHVVPR